MRLREACRIAKSCGLETIGEAVYNIRLHAPSLFTYDTIDLELRELNEEAKEYDEKAGILVILNTDANVSQW